MRKRPAAQHVEDIKDGDQSTHPRKRPAAAKVDKKPAGASLCKKPARIDAISASMAARMPMPWLDEMLDRVTPALKQALKDKLTRLKVLTVASACTGSNVVRASLEALVSKLNVGTVAESFMCEKHRSKLDFCRWVSKYCNDQDCCVFADIEFLGEFSAGCLAHRKPCQIPHGLVKVQ
jgi:hypothetical protein